ncbi:MAG: hypothetical protein R3B70_01660 [Polyangiaceae bacterium]
MRSLVRSGPVRALRFAPLLALLAAAPAASAGEPLVSVSAAPQELCDDGVHLSYSFALELRGAFTFEQIASTQTALVTRDGLDETGALAKAFVATAGLVRGLGPALVLEVDFGLVRLPGAYRVHVEITPKDGGPVQTVVATLTHKGASLSVRNTPLTFQREVWWFEDGPGTLAPASLELQVTSKCSPVTGLLVTPSDRTTDERGSSEGRLEVNPPDVSGGLRAGKPVSIPVSVRTPLPVGTSQGTFRVSGDQLKEDVVTGYVVRSRRPGWLFIPLTYVGGLALSYLLRNLLTRKRDDLEVAEKADKLLAQLDRERSSFSMLAALRHADVRVKLAALGPAVKKLAQAREDGDRAGMSTAIAIVEGALKELDTVRDTLRTDGLSRVAKEIAMADREWVLPKGVEDALSTLKRLLGEEEQRWFEGAFGEVRGRRQEVESAFRTGIFRATREWVSEATSAIDALRHESTPVPPALTATVQGLIPPPPPFDLSPASPVDEVAIKAVLETAHLGNSHLREQAAGLTAAVRGLVQEVNVALGSEPTRAAHVAAMLATIAPLGGGGDLDSVASIRAVTACLPRIEEAVTSIVKELTKEDGGPSLDVKNKLKFKDWPAAVTLALGRSNDDGGKPVAFLESLPPGGSGSPGLGAAPGSGAPWGLGAAPGSGAPRGLGAAPGLPAPVPPAEPLSVLAVNRPNFADRARATRRDLVWVRRGVVAIAAVVGTVIIYVTHARDFVGTLQELFTLFAIGFGAELSLESTTELFRSKRSGG